MYNVHTVYRIFFSLYPAEIVLQIRTFYDHILKSVSDLSTVLIRILINDFNSFNHFNNNLDFEPHCKHMRKHMVRTGFGRKGSVRLRPELMQNV